MLVGMQHLLHNYTLKLVEGQVPLALKTVADMKPKEGLLMHVEKRVVT